MRRIVCWLILLAAFLLLPSSAFGQETEPFDLKPLRELPATGPIVREWKSMPAKMQNDHMLVDLCRAEPGMCSTGALRAIELIDGARQLSETKKLAWVNGRVNSLITFTTDEDQWGVTDTGNRSERWSSALEILQSLKGDCEDYMNVKWFVLWQAGVPPSDMRLVGVLYPQFNQSHIFLSAFWRGERPEWIVLDDSNLKVALQYEVLYSLYSYEIPTHSVVAEAQAR